MGGGASTAGAEAIEELVACTYLLGQALASMSFPDMYRLVDFEDAEGSFEVEVEGGTSIVLNDLTAANQDGWTPLHACCHSHGTARAALAIIDELKDRRKLAVVLDAKTRRGPGSHNAGWTPLHMACAYGLLPVVEALCAAGADRATQNSQQWTPLLEGCHRGFTRVVRCLLDGSSACVLSHVPAVEGPFARPPPQSCLGEAARCGFDEIVKLLLEKGAPKDLANGIGWTPLHEAAFYNHANVVQVLLVYGADATKQDVHGALPYHLASHPQVTDIIADLGGPSATMATRGIERRRHNDDDDDDVPTKPKNVAAPASPAEPAFLHRGELLGDLPALPDASSRRLLLE